MVKLGRLLLCIICVFVGLMVLFPKDKIHKEETIVNVSGDLVEMEDYVVHVLAGEMPASFEMEALKAQCVAIRSYALYQGLKLTKDETTQCYKSIEEMQDMWNEQFDYYYQRLKEAAKETQSQIMTYNGEVIAAYYFAASNGYTSASEDYFGKELPYIKSVASPIEIENYSKAENQVFISNETLKDKFQMDESINMTILSRYENGRVKEVLVNKKKYSGKEIREILKLRSSDFHLKKKDNGYEITTLGYGHGVGMSQYGANGLAKKGYTYEEILNYYYDKIKIESMF